MNVKIILLAVLASSLQTTLGAVVYNESFQGDIDGYGSPPILALSLGENIILGSSHFGTLLNPNTSDSDAFGFTIPAGAQLDLNSIVFEYSLVNTFGDIRSLGLSFWIAATGIDGTWSKTESALSHTLSAAGRGFLYLYTDGSNPNTPLSMSPIENFTFFDVMDSSIDPTRPSAPLQSGLHWLVSGMEKSGIGDHGGSWDYALKLNVSPVPEPSVPILAAFGLALLLNRRIRQQAAPSNGG